MSDESSSISGEALRRAVAKLPAKNEELADDEHIALTEALFPFLIRFVRLLSALEEHIPGAVLAVDWSTVVCDVAESPDVVGDPEWAVPLEPFGTITDDEVTAWSLRGAAQHLNDRGIHPGLVRDLLATAEEIAPLAPEILAVLAEILDGPEC